MQIYSIINRMKSNLFKLKNKRAKINPISKFNSSNNLLSVNKNEVSSNYNIFKNGIVSNSISKDISNKKEEVFKNDIDSISERKTDLLNFVQFDINYLRKISPKNNFNTYEINNNSNIFNWLNISQIKERKMDFINYQFLLGQKNYFKRLFQHFDFHFSSSDSKRINQCLNRESKKYINENSSLNPSRLMQNQKKDFFEQDELNVHQMKEGNGNFSSSSLKNINNINKKLILKLNKSRKIKLKKYCESDIKKLKEILFEYSKRKNNKLIEKEKIIDDDYKEYLKAIPSTESNKSISKDKKLNKKNLKTKIKNLKINALLYDKIDIYHNIKRIKINNNSNIILKNNANKFPKLNKIVLNRKNNLENINKIINKSINL